MANPMFRPKPLEQILAPQAAEPSAPTVWRTWSSGRKPMWAILGEAPPLSWQAPVMPAPLAEQAAADSMATPNGSDVGRFIDELGNGARSWLRGLGRAGDQVLDLIGATNAQDEAAAWRANRIAAETLRQAIAHPDVALEIAKQVTPVARDYVGEHPGVVAGRLAPSLAIGALTPKPYLGGLLGILAAYGDVMHTVRSGADTYDNVVRAALGGQSPEER